MPIIVGHVILFSLSLEPSHFIPGKCRKLGSDHFCSYHAISFEEIWTMKNCEDQGELFVFHLSGKDFYDSVQVSMKRRSVL
jgi:hypothetical protein